MRRFLTYFSLLACSGLWGCPSEIDNVIQASQELAREEAPPVEPGQPSAEDGTTAPGVPIYIDASRSMAGFVGCSARATEFDQVLDRMANDLGSQNVILFGSSSAGAPPSYTNRQLDRAIHCPETYSLTQNPDDRLYTAIASDTTNSAFLYITDGVQSNLSAATPSPSVAALQRWLNNGNALAILAFRSEFAGQLWSEQAGRWLGNVQTDKRPFYVLVLGRSEGTISTTLDRISPAVRAKAIPLRFSQTGVTCSFRRTANVYTEAANLGWFFLEPSATSEFTTSPQPIGNYRCAVAPESPLGAVSARVTAAYRSWDGRSFGPERPIPTGANFRTAPAALIAGGSETKVQASFPPNHEATRFGFYELVLNPIPAAMKPVVDELTTDSDATPETADRTYRFGWLVEHLVRAQFPRMLRPEPIFITVQDEG